MGGKNLKMIIGGFRVHPIFWLVVGSLFLVGYGPARYYFLSTEEVPHLAPFSEKSERSIQKYDACQRRIADKTSNPDTYKRVAFFTPKFVRMPKEKQSEPYRYSARWEFTWVDEQKMERTSFAVCTFKENGQFLDLKVQTLPLK